MIYLDIESSGLDLEKNQILSIGAIDFNNTSNTFYGECKMSPDKTYQEEALKVNGFTVEEIHDQRKKDLAELMADFYNWIPDKEKTIVIGQNVFFDKLFVDKAFKECGIDFKLHHRLIDLHSCVYFYAKKNNIDVDVKNISSDFIANLLGVPVEIKPHNALNGAKQNVLVYNKLFEV